MTSRARTPASASDATTLRRGLAVIRALGEHHEGALSVTALAELLGVDKSQISRTLKALIDEGIVERDPYSRGYRLTWELLRIVSHTLDHRLLQVGRPIVRELVETVRETGHLAVLEGAQVVTLFSHAPPVLMRVFEWTGSTVPAACTASGRALLLDYDSDQLEKTLGSGPLPGHGATAVRTIPELEARLERARALGYVVVREEFELGLTAVAAPVRDFSGRVIASINVSGPDFRVAPRLTEIGVATAEAAARLSAQMGAPTSTLKSTRQRTARPSSPSLARSSAAQRAGG